ncbi:MAG TPA: right-handed parallel beta-helix repeat-containing protein [Actinomycetota bacterium]|nr:right-handed parallel beta-helix repeat-containing protein [Actinomycetota bacterium]
MVRRGLLALALVAPVLCLVRPAAAQEDGYGASVPAFDNVFRLPVVRVEPGATVEWTNQGRAPHDVTADDDAWASPELAPGDGFDRTFEEPGVYAYHCTLHGSPGAGMTGVVVVGDAPLPGPAGDVGPGREPPPAGFAATVRVPQDAPTIQEGVDRAEPGGMVLIERGVYRETVTVTVPFLTIRGVDRNRTIIDGGFERGNGIQVFEADGVVVENLTTRDHLLNGVFWSGVNGYRASYVTASNNGDYGIFAFASRYGQIDHAYASGSPDSGFYVGACYPCDAVITDVEAAHNLLGFSGTNAGGNLAIVNSSWHDNAAGIVPNTLDSEPAAPQRGALIAGNHVYANGNRGAPMRSAEWGPAFGNGIIVFGGRDNLITGNLIEDHPSYGVLLLPAPDERFWPTGGNRVTDNTVRASGLADLAITAPTLGGDCFAGNRARSSTPGAVQLRFPCDGFALGGQGGSMAPWITVGGTLLTDVPLPDYRDQPAPPPQEQMPGDPVAAPWIPAIAEQNVPPSFRIRALGDIASAGATTTKEPTVLGVPIATTWWSLALGLYGYILPLVLYVTWVAIAMWDLIRQESLPIPFRTRWMFVVLIVPFVGPLLYFVWGRSPIPRQLRLVLTAGGIAVYVVIAALAALLA